jgi:hypothetical protein
VELRSRDRIPSHDQSKSATNKFLAFGNPKTPAFRTPNEDQKARADQRQFPKLSVHQGAKTVQEFALSLYREGAKMKKVFSRAAAAAVLVLALSITAASKPESSTWTGWISDSGCGAKGTSADHKDCALKCVREKGAKFVFVNSESKQVFNIHNQDAVKDSDVGMEVKVTGHLMKDKSIHVDSIAPAGGM